MSYRDFMYPDDYDDYFGYHRHYHYKSFEEKKKLLENLIAHIKSLEWVKHDIMNYSASLSKLSQLGEILKSEIQVFPGNKESKFSLLNHKNLEKILWMNDLDDIKLDVRRGLMHMPKYYLCEVKSNYFGNYGIVIADYFNSPDYKFDDPRFVRLMHHGHELYFIRMAEFREKTEKMFPRKTENLSDKVDKVLSDVGQHFLQGAWHEDQVISWMVSEHFQLPKFKEAMEAIYFSLGSDFCEVRQQITEDVKGFFKSVYKQPALLALINKIECSEGNEFQNLELKSRSWYEAISKAFNGLLQCEIEWGLVQKNTVPLYKVVFSNIYRLQLVEQNIRENEDLIKSCELLENVAGNAIEELIG